MRTPALLFAITAAVTVGCTSRTPTVTNPFNSADRVPPPTLRAGDGVAAPTYYPGATATAPAAPAWPATAPAAPGFQQAAPTFQQQAPAFQQAPATFPPAAPATQPGSATPVYGTPPIGGSASRSRPRTSAVASGDSIAIPNDSGSLRFATQAESSLARAGSQPLPRTNATQLAAAPAPARRPATASGWIAGSAPVRSSTPTVAPRVRMPGGGEFAREPVSLAAIGGPSRVPIAPLEPAPAGNRPGESAPLRVATPQTGTGWR
ncbi:MAG: hypothetical protein AAF266_02355 [Planctomycetota bacterium]